MEWYVLNHNFNGKKIENFNIFNSFRFQEGVDKLLKKYTTFDEFKEELKHLLMYCFWSKSEYEIVVGSLYVKEPDLQKLDVYYQVLPNLDTLARYIVFEYNKHKRKKLVVD